MNRNHSFRIYVFFTWEARGGVSFVVGLGSRVIIEALALALTLALTLALVFTIWTADVTDAAMWASAMNE